MRARGLTGAALLLALFLGFAPGPAWAVTDLSRPASLTAALTQLEAARAAGIARAYVPLRIFWTAQDQPLSRRARLWLRGVAGDPLQAARLALRGWLLLAYTAALFAAWHYLLLLLLYAGQFCRDRAGRLAWLALPFFAVPLLWRYATPAEQRLSRSLLGIIPVGLLLLGALPAMLAAQAPAVIAFTAAGRGSILEFWLAAWSPSLLVPGLSPFALWNYGWPLLLGWCCCNALGIWISGGSLLAAPGGPGGRRRRSVPAACRFAGDGRARLRLMVLARLMPGYAAAYTGRLAVGAWLAGWLALAAALALLPAPWWREILAGTGSRRSLVAAALTGYAIIALAVECWRAPARLRFAWRKTDAVAASAAGGPLER